MIIIKISGGLGNQLFKLNKALEINKNYKNLYLDLFSYESDKYKRDYHFYNDLDQLKILSPNQKRLLNKTKKILNRANVIRHYDEKLNNYQDFLTDKVRIKFLSGNWEENVNPDDNNLYILRSLFQRAESKNDKIVAVHFRTKDYEIRLEEDYYRKAIEEFNNDYIFHIFGDDDEYLKDKIPSIFKNRNFELFNSDNPIDDFERLLSYRNYISSNSTFCWWGIMLNDKNNLNVISPKTWIKDRDYQIFKPETWKQI